MKLTTWVAKQAQFPLASQEKLCYLAPHAQHIARQVAGVAELVDAPDLGSGAARRGGSSPFTRTIKTSLFARFINILWAWLRVSTIHFSRVW